VPNEIGRELVFSRSRPETGQNLRYSIRYSTGVRTFYLSITRWCSASTTQVVRY